MFNAYKAIMSTTMSAIINIVILAGLHSQIWAMPVDNLGCKSSNNNFQALADLVQKARIVDMDENRKPKDDRMPLDVLAHKFNWSGSKEEMFYWNTGQIHCPGMPLTTDGTPLASDAFIAGSDVTLATVEHAFFKDDGTPYIRLDKFKDCYFQNRVGYRVGLIFEPGTHVFGNKGTIQGVQQAGLSGDIKRDWAIVRLAHPIPNAHGIPVDPTGSLPNEGRTLLNVSQFQEGMPTKYKGKTIGQYCKNGKNHFTVRATCDSSGGISGSLMAIEEGRETVVAIGIANAGVPADAARDFRDGDSFNYRTNTANVLPFSPELIGEIRRIAGGRQVQVADVSH